MNPRPLNVRSPPLLALVAAGNPLQKGELKPSPLSESEPPL
jgi:hypothetical protein